MFKRFFILLFFILSSLIVLAEDFDIDHLELIQYGKTYEYESLGERLNRLENDLLGMSQSGDVDSRLNKLAKVMKKDIQAPKRVAAQQETYPTPKKRSFFKEFMSNLSDTFDDTCSITGYTPNLYYSGSGLYSNPYSSYNNYRNYLHNYNPPPYPHNRYYRSPMLPPPHKISHKHKFNNPNFYHGFNNRFNNNFYQRRYNNTPYYIPENIVTKTSVRILDD